MMKMRIAALLFLFWIAQSGAAQDVVEVTTGEYTPWTSESLKHNGFTSHVISEAFALEGYTVKFTYYPWKRAFDLAKNGDRFHATSYWYDSDERKKDFLYSDPIQVDRYVFFHLKDKPFPDWSGLEDLGNLRIGATSGYTYTDEFWSAGKSGILNISEANSDELNFKKLLKGRIDAFPVGPLVGQMLLNDRFSPEEVSKLAFDDKPLLAVDGHLLFPKSADKSESLIAVFNRGLEKLRASGRYAELEADLVAGRYEQ